MGASAVLMFNERTSCWRVQTPGSPEADTDMTAWGYSPRRGSIVWGMGDDPASLYRSAPDDELDDAIEDGHLQTYPLLPDGDASALKRFHEVVFTFSLLDDVLDDLLFSVSFGTGQVDETELPAPRSLPGNVSPPSVAEPAYFQLKAMVGRAVAISPYLIVNLKPVSGGAEQGRWRLHAIEVAWEPVSNRTYNRG